MTDTRDTGGGGFMEKGPIGRNPSAAWFHDDEFDLPLPPEVSDAVRQFYGTGQTSVDFAQSLASFLVDQGNGWVLTPAAGERCPHCGSRYEVPEGLTPHVERSADYPPHAWVAIWGWPERETRPSFDHLLHTCRRGVAP